MSDTIEIRGRFPDNPSHGATVKQSMHDVAGAVQRRAVADIDGAIPAHGEARAAYNATVQALAAVAGAIDQGARRSVAAAQDDRVYPVGRADAIDAHIDGAEQVVASAGTVAAESAQELRAHLEQMALPAEPTGDKHAAAVADLRLLLDSTAEKDRGGLFDRLASRGDATSGWLLGDGGRELARSLWGEKAGEARHVAARARALADAAAAGDKYARAARAAADLLSANGAYKASWTVVRRNLRGLSDDMRGRATGDE